MKGDDNTGEVSNKINNVNLVPSGRIFKNLTTRLHERKIKDDEEGYEHDIVLFDKEIFWEKVKSFGRLDKRQYIVGFNHHILKIVLRIHVMLRKMLRDGQRS
jgi:hypothetical protein